MQFLKKALPGEALLTVPEKLCITTDVLKKFMSHKVRCPSVNQALWWKVHRRWLLFFFFFFCWITSRIKF
eukprot:jgi/Botrbrau1/23257/Bobra.0102s0002.1